MVSGKTEASDRSELFDALWNGDVVRLQEYINTLFAISYHDYQENFYHAFLAGQLSRKGYVVNSNREEGLDDPTSPLRIERTAEPLSLKPRLPIQKES